MSSLTWITEKELKREIKTKTKTKEANYVGGKTRKFYSGE